MKFENMTDQEKRIWSIDKQLKEGNMEIKVNGKGWRMIVKGVRDCQKLILKGRDTEEIRSLIPAKWWIEAKAEIAAKEDQGKQKEKAFSNLGLVEIKGRWEVPEGNIVVTSEGPAEEHLPGFFRSPDGLRFEDSEITAIMADSEGNGLRKRIVGIIPIKSHTNIKARWSDGLNIQQIEEILSTDEEGEQQHQTLKWRAQ